MLRLAEKYNTLYPLETVLAAGKSGNLNLRVTLSPADPAKVEQLRQTDREILETLYNNLLETGEIGLRLDIARTMNM